MTGSKKGKNLFLILGIIQVFVALGALGGGIGLVADPSGKNLTWTTEMLKDTPFSDFMIPGIFLLLVLGVGHSIGAIYTFRNHEFSGTLAILLGITLTVWICIQVYLIGLASFLQPLFLAIGFVEFVLGFIIFRRT